MKGLEERYCGIEFPVPGFLITPKCGFHLQRTDHGDNGVRGTGRHTWSRTVVSRVAFVVAIEHQSLRAEFQRPPRVNAFVITHDWSGWVEIVVSV